MSTLPGQKQPDKAADGEWEKLVVRCLPESSKIDREERQVRDHQQAQQEVTF